jgi:glucan phosphoethanolaminetransferase (alkaline phosphatase superfamily)
MSVPQIITRATPDNYDAQYREKSILGAFKEAGFKTFWLSNQSDQDIFWSGSIVLHAKTADEHTFSPTYSPNLEFENVYDGRLLPLLDSILESDDENLFIVLHTMGSHWEYSRRYPPEFDLFQPSGHTQSINPYRLNREAILNSYDNSIFYSDYFIHSVIGSVKRWADLSVVTYISDHGEDLFDSDAGVLDFHLRPSAATLRVPLFIWTSDSYNHRFAEKRRNLEASLAKKIGTENLFYTLLDIANIRTDAFDSTKSFAHPHFLPSQQKFYGDGERARWFSELP